MINDDVTLWVGDILSMRCDGCLCIAALKIDTCVNWHVLVQNIGIIS